MKSAIMKSAIMKSAIMKFFDTDIIGGKICNYNKPVFIINIKHSRRFIYGVVE